MNVITREELDHWLGEKRTILPLSGAEMRDTNARNCIRALTPFVWGFKFHPSTIIRLFREGLDVIAECKNVGAKIFVDLKGHDIPSEVENMVRDLEEVGVDIITIHAAGGREMLSAAIAGRRTAKLLAITILTSMDNFGVQAIYGSSKKPQRDLMRRKIMQFAAMALESGFDGTVSSASDLRMIKDNPRVDDGLRIRCTPGIRPASLLVEGDDQRRVLTPAKAIVAGADLLVVGRPILKADNIRAAAQKVHREISKVLYPSQP